MRGDERTESFFDSGRSWIIKKLITILLNPLGSFSSEAARATCANETPDVEAKRHVCGITEIRRGVESGGQGESI